MLRDVGLDEERRALGVETRGQPVNEDLAGVLTDAGGVLVVRRERVPVGDEVETLVLGLEAQEVVERAEEVPQMQHPARLHSAQDTFGHGRFYPIYEVKVEMIVVVSTLTSGPITMPNRWIWGSATTRKKMISIP